MSCVNGSWKKEPAYIDACIEYSGRISVGDEVRKVTA